MAKLESLISSIKTQALVNETLRQHEATKRTVEFLRADVAKALHEYNSTTSELDQSRTVVDSLETLVSKLEFSLFSNKRNHSLNVADNGNKESKAEILKKVEDPNPTEA